MIVAFQTNSNSHIGMGHLMRCLAIAETMNHTKQDFFFIMPPDSDTNILDKNNIPYYHADNNMDIKIILQKEGANILILDSYNVKYDEMKDLNKFIPLIYIDDLNLFPYPVTGIINYNIEASIEMYKKCTSKTSFFLIGPSYFPARKEFINNNNFKLNQNLRNVLVTTGATDPYNISSILAEILCTPKYKDINFLFLEGLFFDSNTKKKLKILSQKLNNLHLLPWGQKMGQIYQKCDLVISPGSTTIFEAFTIGVPCISFSFTDNHLPQCNIMTQTGICPYIGDFRNNIELTKQTLKIHFNLLQNYKIRQDLYNGYKKIFDGKGSERIIYQVRKHYENNLRQQSICSTL